jgi:hypothetical protein
VDGLGWLLVSFLPFLLVQHWLHREIQAVFLIITRRLSLAVGLFSIIFFPGVLLHELSHFLAAKILRVPTGRFSLLPKALPDGKVRLGYVETAKVDFLRDAIIGIAPLVTGSLLIAYFGIARMNLLPLAGNLGQADWAAFITGMKDLPAHTDFWIWFYLVFTISSTMLPSSSDRRGWLPILIGILVVVGLILLAGAGPWLAEHLAPTFNRFLRSLTMVFGISLVVHLVLLIPTAIIRWLLCKLFKVRVELPY